MAGFSRKYTRWYLREAGAAAMFLAAMGIGLFVYFWDQSSFRQKLSITRGSTSGSRFQIARRCQNIVPPKSSGSKHWARAPGRSVPRPRGRSERPTPGGLFRFPELVRRVARDQTEERIRTLRRGDIVQHRSAKERIR
jgi:hypothetical protein